MEWINGRSWRATNDRTSGASAVALVVRRHRSAVAAITTMVWSAVAVSRRTRVLRAASRRTRRWTARRARRTSRRTWRSRWRTRNATATTTTVRSGSGKATLWRWAPVGGKGREMRLVLIITKEEGESYQFVEQREIVSDDCRGGSLMLLVRSTERPACGGC